MMSTFATSLPSTNSRTPRVSSQAKARWVQSRGPGTLSSLNDTRVRARLASVTKASKPWPFQSIRSQAMSQLLWSA